MKRQKNIFIFILSLSLLQLFVFPSPLQAAQCSFPHINQSSLKEYASIKNLKVGANYGEEYFYTNTNQQADLLNLVNKEYGNGGIHAVQHGLLFKQIQPVERGQFNFAMMNKWIDQAGQYGLKLHGFHLLWRSWNSPRWLFQPEDKGDESHCGNWTKEQLREIIRDHIITTVQHGGNNFYAWNVVNEAFVDSGIRNRCFYKIMGEDYIKDAFRFARQANPNAILVLNDYFAHNGINKAKATTLFNFVKRVKGEGVPIDAVGIQTHLRYLLNLQDYEDDFRWFLQQANQANVKVIITEMDVYEGPNNLWEHQKAIYKAVVKTCLESPNCIAFYTWGLSDNHSWLRNTDGPNIPDADPLLFDRNYQRKPAYYGVIEAIKENTSRGCFYPTPIPSPTPTPSPSSIPGDITDYGDTPGDEVNIYDYNLLVSDFGKTGTPGWIKADIIENGGVDIFDYNVLVENFGK